MATIKQIQRSQFVVDPEFQYGFILKFTFLVAGVLLVSLVLQTIFLNLFINTALPVSVETGGVISFEAIQSISMSDEIRLALVVMLISVIIGAVAVYYFGRTFSNKISGPVLRLKNYIADMNHGDLDKKVSLRQKDYFQPLAMEMNSLRQHWHDSVLELQDINRKLNIGAGEKQKEMLDRSSTILSDLLKNIS